MIEYSMEYPVAEHDFWSPFCNLDFVMAHKVLARPWYAKQLLNRPPGRIVILDNGMHEGKMVNNVEMVAAARECNADYVIPPDRLGDFDFNMKEMLELDAMRTVTDAKWQMAPVLCGNSEMLRRQFMTHARNIGAGMICLPFKEDRYDWLMEVQHEVMDGPFNLLTRIHLLGVNEISELRRFYELSIQGAWSTLTWSVDTAKAYKWGMQWQDLRGTVRSIRGANLRSDELLDLKVTPSANLRIIVENIHFLKSVCAGR